MKATDFLLCLIDASGGAIRGRTLLQKTAYFVAQQVGFGKRLDFIPHFYGPFSPTVDEALGKLSAFGFVDEGTTGFGAVNRSGFEVRRHDYALTDDGSQIVEAIKRNEPEAYQNIRDAVQRIRGAGDPDYLELSIAAKTYLILKRKGRPLTADEVRSAARELNWEITEQSIQKAVGLLEKLGFVQTT